MKGYASHERETFDEVTKARTAAQQAQTVAGQAQAENALTAAIGRLFAVAEAYPQLRDPAMRMLCSINLQFEGLVVLEAADGRRGLARARSERPDLVLTDVAVPRLDGFQLAEALRREEHTRQIPLIFLSGETTAGARAHKLGALAYLTKPLDPPTLASLIADELARAGKRERPAAPRRTNSPAAAHSAA